MCSISKTFRANARTHGHELTLEVYLDVLKKLKAQDAADKAVEELTKGLTQSACFTGFSTQDIQNICAFWLKGKGMCKNGASCRFAHPEGQEGSQPNTELPKRGGGKGSANSVKKTKIPKEPQNDTQKNQGASEQQIFYTIYECIFAVAANIMPNINGVCIFWLVLGKCKYIGDRCKLKHPEDKKGSMKGQNLSKLLKDAKNQGLNKGAEKGKGKGKGNSLKVANVIAHMSKNPSYAKALYPAMETEILKNPSLQKVLGLEAAQKPPG